MNHVAIAANKGGVCIGYYIFDKDHKMLRAVVHPECKGLQNVETNILTHEDPSKLDELAVFFLERGYVEVDPVNVETFGLLTILERHDESASHGREDSPAQDG